MLSQPACANARSARHPSHSTKNTKHANIRYFDEDGDLVEGLVGSSSPLTRRSLRYVIAIVLNRPLAR